MDKLLEAKMPEGWVIVQSLATVDSTTYDLYMNNMRAMMQEQVFSSDVVIFNRTDDDTDRGHLRRTIKNINRKAQIVYERKDGTIDERPEELPFDINQDVIELTDADYAIWYMDAMENYKKYDHKKVKFLALVYNPDKLKKAIQQTTPYNRTASIYYHHLLCTILTCQCTDLHFSILAKDKLCRTIKNKIIHCIPYLMYRLYLSKKRPNAPHFISPFSKTKIPSNAQEMPSITSIR